MTFLAFCVHIIPHDFKQAFKISPEKFLISFGLKLDIEPDIQSIHHKYETLNLRVLANSMLLT